ncbi:MAG: T9SS type A sorting domain-containing protein, partial [Bacteroidia bacterium]
FRVYPNPTSGMVNIRYTENISRVVLMNVLGQVVLEERPNLNEVAIDLSTLPSATYFVKVESNGKVKVVKVIKRD